MREEKREEILADLRILADTSQDDLSKGVSKSLISNEWALELAQGAIAIIEETKFLPKISRNVAYYVWHVIKARSKYGKTVYRIRRLYWESYVISVCNNGDDGRYFATKQEAEECKEKLELELKAEVAE